MDQASPCGVLSKVAHLTLSYAVLRDRVRIYIRRGRACDYTLVGGRISISVRVARTNCHTFLSQVVSITTIRAIYIRKDLLETHLNVTFSANKGGTVVLGHTFTHSLVLLSAKVSSSLGHSTTHLNVFSSPKISGTDGHTDTHLLVSLSAKVRGCLGQ